MRVPGTSPKSYIVIKQQWEDDVVEDKEWKEGKVESRPVWWPALTSYLSLSPSLSLYSSLDWLLFFQ